jgi:hypothetical protein|tara:strand:- start:783 stop:1052 length:270 start_codon:yes stop_codon:yes gene_type:complete
MYGAPAHTFEPVSALLSIVGGSIFCKMIKCETVTTNIVYVRDRDSEKMNKRLQKMKEEFEWEEEFCRPSPALEEGEKFCFKNGIWKVVK